MSNISKYKKLLSGSTSMPYGTGTAGGAGSPFMTGGHLHGGHTHGPGCGCGPATDEDDEE